MASIETESFKTNVVALRSLLAVANEAARKHNESLADSTEFYMSTVQPQMENASNFIVDKLATLSATRKTKKKSTVCKLCIVSAIIDGLTLVYEAGTSGGLAQKCSPVVVIAWWVMGLLTMTIEQKLPFVDALDMLAQQFTSVGYGSSSQDTDGIKIFHGLHGIVSQMSVNRVMTEFFASALNSLEKLFADKIGRSPDVLSASVNLLGIGALITFIFALDLGEGKKLKLLDGFYQAVITMTTIGYGDMSPTTDWGKAISPLTLPTIVQAFGRWNAAAGPDSAEENAKVVSASFADAEVCKCLGMNFCGGSAK